MDSHKKCHQVSGKLVKHTLFVASRNAMYAIIGRILIGLLKRILKKGVNGMFMKDIGKEVFSLDPLKWATVFYGFTLFRLLKEVILSIGNFLHISNKAAAFFAGCLCSLPTLVMNKETRTNLSLYLFVRGLQSFCVGHVLPSMPSPIREFDHYDVLTMCMCSSQILYSVLFAPYTMPPSYQTFLNRAALLDHRVVRSHAGLTRYQITPELVEMCMERGFEIPQSAREHLSIGCSYAHPGMTCNAFFLSFIWKNIFQIGIPLYFPLKILTIIAFQTKELTTQPLKLIRSTIRSVLRSSLFLALYSASTVRFACIAAQRNIHSGLFTAIACSLSGVATLLEPKGRRSDLALYCLMYAIRSFVMTQYRLGRLLYPRHNVVFLLYVLSTAYLFYQYDQEPDVLNTRVRTMIAKLLSEKCRISKDEAEITEEVEAKRPGSATS